MKTKSLLHVLFASLLFVVGCKDSTDSKKQDSNQNTVQDQAPGSFSITSAFSGNSQVTLTWGTSSNATSYIVRYGTTSGNYPVEATVVSPYTVTGLTNGTPYYFTVRAVNSAGSTQTAEVSATPSSGTTAILPGAFTITSAVAGNGQVTLAWATSANAASYTVKYGTTSGNFPNTASTSASSPYTATGLTNGTTYYFMVTAVNVTGSTNATAQVSATPLPSLPGPFTISAVAGNAQVALNGTGSANSTSYTVKYGTSSGSYPTIATTNATSWPYVVGGLTNGTTYYFMITAVNAAGSTNATTEVSATPSMPIPLPGPFTISTIAGNGQATVSWTASSNATSYSVKYGTTSGSYPNTASTSASSPYTVTGLTNGTTYYFMVTAVNVTGSTNATAQASATPLAPLPGSFSITTATAGTNQVQLNWGASSGAVSYTVKYGTTSGVYPTTASISAIAPYTVTGLTGGTLYYFMVTAVNGSGQTNANAQVSATPVAPLPPPGAFSINAAVAGASSSVQLDWGISSNAASYTVKYGTASGVYPNTASISAIAPYTVTALTSGTTYYFRVIAVNTAGTTQSANELTAVPSISGMPGSFSITSATAGNSQVTLSWGASTNATSYTVKYGTSSSTINTTAVSNLTSTSHIVTGLTNGTTYYFKVTAVNISGTIDASPVSASPSSSLPLPGAFSISPAATSSGSVTLSWGVSTNASSYTIKYGTTSGSYSTIASTNATSPYTVTGLTNNTTYFFMVTAINTNGSTNANTQVSATPQPQIPGAFSITSATPTASGKITLVWGSSVDAATYTVKYGTTSGSYPTVVTTNGTSPYTITGLTNGTTYYFKVVAQNIVGATNSTNELSAIPAVLAPGAFSIGSTTAGHEKITLAWGGSVDAVSYTVKYGTSATSINTIFTTSAISPINVTGLTNGTTYYFQVVAVNSVGSTNSTNTPSATPIPILPGNFTITQAIPSINKISLAWGASTNATSYTIKYGTSSTAINAIFSTSANSPMDVTGLTNGTTYYIQVIAINSAGSTNSTNTSSVISPAGTSLAIQGAISSAQDHTCAIQNGAAKCWGGNSYGQLGNGTMYANSLIPVAVNGLSSGVQAISVYEKKSCAIQNGAAKCWGAGFGSTPVGISGLGIGVQYISVGKEHTCAIVNGAAKCWGTNNYGQLGNGTTIDSSIPVTVLGSGVQQISLGEYHTCAIQNGAAKCWGHNYLSQLGNGSTTDSSIPVAVAGLGSNVQKISVGAFSACAIQNGAAKCWGGNYGSTLVSITGLNNGVDTISDSWSTTCAIQNGAAKCWNSLPNPTPATINGLNSGVQAVSYGSWHGCAIQNGAAKCWGTAGWALGDGSGIASATPVDVLGISSNLQSSSGGIWHGCAITQGGVSCWGDNQYGQLGNGTFVNSNTFVPVSGISNVSNLSSGNYHNCAVSDGAAKCWGRNNMGQLGNNSTTNSNSPVTVSSLSAGVQKVASGGQHSCALVDGGVKCWGSNTFGQLGNASTINSQIPVSVSGLSTGVTKLISGENHSCAIQNGLMKCWGSNSEGQLGIGSTVNSNVPVQVSGLTDVQAISAGFRNTCAVVNGSAKCWGGDGVGQLGNDTAFTPSLVPVQVFGLISGVQDIVSGQSHSCALVDGGALCWGSNDGGQLGNNSLINSGVPVTATGLTSGVQEIYAGGYTGCAMMNAGLQCWGWNNHGQLGDNSTTNSLVPIFTSGL